MLYLVIRIQIVLVIGVRQVIREVRHDGLYHSISIQPGLISLLCILRKEAVLCDRLTDLRKQVLTGMCIIDVGEPTIVIQTEVYRIKISPVASKQTAAGNV